MMSPLTEVRGQKSENRDLRQVVDTRNQIGQIIHFRYPVFQQIQ